jgi:hypothetical protein
VVSIVHKRAFKDYVFSFLVVPGVSEVDCVIDRPVEYIVLKDGARATDVDSSEG